jgi:hypothetical protein
MVVAACLVATCLCLHLSLQSLPLPPLPPDSGSCLTVHHLTRPRSQESLQNSITHLHVPSLESMPLIVVPYWLAQGSHLLWFLEAPTFRFAPAARRAWRSWCGLYKKQGHLHQFNLMSRVLVAFSSSMREMASKLFPGCQSKCIVIPQGASVFKTGVLSSSLSLNLLFSPSAVLSKAFPSHHNCRHFPSIYFHQKSEEMVHQSRD